MFSFHKPKVYRSSTGCCICRAKSSTSRFTDSRKYEDDFQDCFQLFDESRQGEICNACVLLVKRFKRLPFGSGKNWSHVVDARAGPGMKCMNKFRKRRDELSNTVNAMDLKPTRIDVPDKEDRESSPGVSEEYSSEEEVASNEDCRPMKPPPLPVSLSSSRRKSYTPVKRNSSVCDTISFFDMDIWKKETVCCGEVYKGPNSMLAVDPRYFKSCSLHSKVGKIASLTKMFSDNSSDSGYDEFIHSVQLLASRNLGGDITSTEVEETGMDTGGVCPSICKSDPCTIKTTELDVNMQVNKGMVIMKQQCAEEVPASESAITPIPRTSQ